MVLPSVTVHGLEIDMMRRRLWREERETGPRRGCDTEVSCQEGLSVASMRQDSGASFANLNLAQGDTVSQLQLKLRNMKRIASTRSRWNCPCLRRLSATLVVRHDLRCWSKLRATLEHRMTWARSRFMSMSQLCPH